jgi:hypothetical protein
MYGEQRESARREQREEREKSNVMKKQKERSISRQGRPFT